MRLAAGMLAGKKRHTRIQAQPRLDPCDASSRWDMTGGFLGHSACLGAVLGPLASHDPLLNNPLSA